MPKIADVQYLHCVRCNVALTSGWAAPNVGISAVETLSEGVICSTHGNYGSQVFDGEGTLIFALCDKCLLKASYGMVFIPTKWYGKDLDGVSGRYYNRKTRCINAADHFVKWLRWMREQAFKLYANSSIAETYAKFRDCLNHNSGKMPGCKKILPPWRDENLNEARRGFTEILGALGNKKIDETEKLRVIGIYAESFKKNYMKEID